MNWTLDASVALRWFIEEEIHPHAALLGGGLKRLVDLLLVFNLDFFFRPE